MENNKKHNRPIRNFLGLIHQDAEGVIKTPQGETYYHATLSPDCDLSQEELDSIMRKSIEHHSALFRVIEKDTKALLNNFFFDSFNDVSGANNKGYSDGKNLRQKSMPENPEEARLYLRGYIYGKFYTNICAGPKSKLP